MEYVIIQYFEKNFFEKMVNEKLNEGWELCGGVCISWNGGNMIYAQAMTKNN